MIRLLLSLLALVSGLAVQVGPAQAQLRETQIGAPAPARLAAQVTARVAAFTLVQSSPSARGIGLALRLPAARIIASPGVLIGIDRAHE